MKNVFNTVLAAFAFTMLTMVSFGQSSVNYQSTIINYSKLFEIETQTFKVYGEIFGTDIRKDKVQVSIYELNESNCEWVIISKKEDNKFSYSFERNKEYQIQFNDGNKIKILQIDKGYQGAFSYKIDANFTTNRSARMIPTEEGNLFLVYYLSEKEIECFINKE